MSVISGVNGAVYWNEEITDTADAGTITFSSGDGTIISTGINFLTEGYLDSMFVTISGAASTGNNQTVTFASISSGGTTVTVATGETLVLSVNDTGVITFLEAEPGYEEAGFYNWTVNYKVNLLDTTAFDTSSGGRSYLTGITDWTASADKFFLTTTNPVDEWLGETVKVRFFLNYVATPSTGSPSQYYEGNTIVTGIDVGTPVDALVTHNIGFQGVGALTLTTRTTAWNS